MALHGWLDNSNTYSLLGPYLADRGCHIIAIDQVGHGMSTRIPPESMYHFAQYISHVREILIQLEWERGILMGHSMGGIISTLFSGTFPENVDRTILIEGFSPITTSASEASRNLRRAIEAEAKSRSKGFFSKPPTEYVSLNHAIDARIKTVADYPGNQYISREAARDIVIG